MKKDMENTWICMKFMTNFLIYEEQRYDLRLMTCMGIAHTCYVTHSVDKFDREIMNQQPISMQDDRLLYQSQFNLHMIEISFDT